MTREVTMAQLLLYQAMCEDPTMTPEEMEDGLGQIDAVMEKKRNQKNKDQDNESLL